MTPVDKFLINSDYRTSTQSLDDLAMSIKSTGLYQPIIVKPIEDWYEIVAGRRRFRAMTQYLGWQTLEEGEHFLIKEGTDALIAQFQENFNREDFTPIEMAKLVKDIHDKKIREYGPAVKGQEGGWGIRDTGYLIGRGSSFVSKMLTIDRNRSEVQEKETVSSALDKIDNQTRKKMHNKVKKTVYERQTEKVLPDLDAQLGNVKVMEAEKYLSQCKDESFDTVLTDAPYAINLDQLGQSEDPDYYYEDDPDKVKAILDFCVPEYHRVLKDGSYCIIWTGIQHYQYLRDLMKRSGFLVPNTPLFWIKTHTGGMTRQPDKLLSSRVEMGLYALKGDATLAQSGKGNAFHADIVRGDSRIHPAQKPDSLYEQILLIFTQKNAKVLDTFAGSLALLRACYKTGRVFYGCDSSEEYTIDAVNQTRRWGNLRDGGSE